MSVCEIEGENFSNRWTDMAFLYGEDYQGRFIIILGESDTTLLLKIANRKLKVESLFSSPLYSCASSLRFGLISIWLEKVSNESFVYLSYHVYHNNGIH